MPVRPTDPGLQQRECTRAHKRRVTTMLGLHGVTIKTHAKPRVSAAFVAACAEGRNHQQAQTQSS